MHTFLFLALSLSTVPCLPMKGVHNAEALLNQGSLTQSVWGDWKKVVCQSFLSRYEDVVLKSGRITTKFLTKNRESYRQGFELGELKAGRMLIQWTGVESGRLVLKHMWLQVEAYQDAWVVQRTVRAGSKIRARSVRRSLANVAPYIGVKSLIGRSPVGLKSAVYLKAGSVLIEKHIVFPPIVDKGAKVNVSINKGGIKIVVKGTVLSPVVSYLDQVMVKIKSTNKVLSGYLEDASLVVVEL